MRFVNRVAFWNGGASRSTSPADAAQAFVDRVAFPSHLPQRIQRAGALVSGPADGDPELHFTRGVAEDERVHPDGAVLVPLAAHAFAGKPGGVIRPQAHRVVL